MDGYKIPKIIEKKQFSKRKQIVRYRDRVSENESYGLNKWNWWKNILFFISENQVAFHRNMFCFVLFCLNFIHFFSFAQPLLKLEYWKWTKLAQCVLNPISKNSFFRWKTLQFLQFNWIYIRMDRFCKFCPILVEWRKD